MIKKKRCRTKLFYSHFSKTHIDFSAKEAINNISFILDDHLSFELFAIIPSESLVINLCQAQKKDEKRKRKMFPLELKLPLFLNICDSVSFHNILHTLSKLLKVAQTFTSMLEHGPNTVIHHCIHCILKWRSQFFWVQSNTAKHALYSVFYAEASK